MFPPFNSPKRQASRRVKTGKMSYPGSGKIMVPLASHEQFVLPLFGFLILTSFPLIEACLGSDIWWVYAPSLWIAVMPFLFTEARLRRSVKTSLILDRDTVSLSKSGVNIWELSWGQIGQIELNSPTQRLIFRNEEGSLLARTPRFMLSQSDVASLIAVMKVRSGEEIRYFRVSERAAGKRTVRLVRGSVAIASCFVAWIGAVLGSGTSHIQVEHLVCLFLTGSVLGMLGAWEIHLANTWDAHLDPSDLSEYRFDGTLLPYLHWLLAGDAIPGDHEFQYVAKDLLKDRKETTKSLIGPIALITLLASFVCFMAARTSTSYVDAIIFFACVLIPIFLWNIYVYSSKRELVEHRHDEIVISGSTISVWHKDAYVPVTIAEVPRLNLKSRFKSELVLTQEGSPMIYDPLEMNVLK